MKFRCHRVTRVCGPALLLISGCLAAPGSPSGNDAGALQTYSAQGVVENIAPDHHKATIHHQAIPGYMMEMTMDFPVKNDGELAGISLGDKITFTLTVNKDTEWIDHIQRVGHAGVAATSALSVTGVKPSTLVPGDSLPDGDFVTENGRTMHFSDFRGKVVAFTFFFTRCPLPDYCPLMNRHFDQTRDILLASPKGPTNWQFLSLSFDSGFDHPGVLSAYARMYRGEKTDHWIFGTASDKTLADVGAPLGLMIMRQEGGIAHNLRTVVLDTQGRIYHQFNDNQWTPQQLAAIMRAAMLASQRK